MIIDANGFNLFCDRSGAGPAMLTFHGPGFDHMMLKPWLDRLGDTVELVYYDQRGSGRSQCSDLSDVTNETWVLDADAVRASLGLNDVVVFGHSYGGCLVQEYALAFPDRVRGLVLCSTMPAFDYPEAMLSNARARATAEEFEAIISGFSAPARDDDAFRDLWTRILPVYFHRPGEGMAQLVESQQRLSAAASNRAIFACLPGFTTLDRLDGIKAPTLVLAGRDDWVTPPDHGAVRISRLIPNARLRIFESSGHFPFIEEQEAFVATVRDWLLSLP
jgi:proline iminopeptidase